MTLRCFFPFLIASAITLNSWSAEIHDAAAKGDTDKLRTLLEKNPKLVDAPDTLQFTPLHHAARADQFGAVTLLLEHKANPNRTTRNGETPLHFTSDPRIIRALVEAGASPNVPDGSGNSPLQAFVNRSRQLTPEKIAAAIEAFLQHGADLNRINDPHGTALHLAVRHRIHATAEALLKHKPNLELRDRDGRTPFLLAAYHADVRLMQLLADAGANIKAVAPNEDSALTLAIQNRVSALDAVKYLLQHKFDLNQPDKSGRTPLHHAAGIKNPAVVKLLLQNGADPNPKNDPRFPKQLPPLAVAINTDDIETIQLLLEHKSDPNAGAPLALAARRKNLESVEVLLKSTADPNLPDGEGNRPLFFAARDGNRLMADRLLKAGADPNLPSARGALPLHAAVEKSDKLMVEMLLKAGADPSKPDDARATAVTYATRKGDKVILDILLENIKEPPPPEDRANILRNAVVGGRLNILKTILEKEKDPVAAVNSRAAGDSSLLHLAAFHDQLDIARELIARGAHVNAQTDQGFTPLHSAKSAAMIRLLLEHGADPNALTKTEERTPLMQRLQSPTSPEIVRLFIEHKTDIAAADKNGDTALHHAAHRPDGEVVALLLKAGANPNARNKVNATPLHHAAAAGHFAVAKLLLEHGANPNAQADNEITPLHRAVERGHAAVVKLLLDHKADPNARDALGRTPYLMATEDRNRANLADLFQELPLDVTSADADGNTLLHVVARSGNPRQLQLILARKPNLAVKNKNGETPLHVAAAYRVRASTEEFLKAGANPNARDNNDNSPLHLATRSESPLSVAARPTMPPLGALLGGLGATTTPSAPTAARTTADAAVVELLLAHKADPNLKNKKGETPLLLACASGNAKSVEALIAAKADLRARDSDGNTALILAAQSGNKALLQTILTAKPDLNAANNMGWTALHRAASNGNRAALETLLAHKPNLNPLDKIKMTPLHLAVKQGHLDATRLLLQYKADPNIANTAGWAPLHTAVADKKRPLVELLLEHKANPNAKTADGKTPLYIANEINNPDLADLLKQHGAK
jgi:ankyrin